MNDELQFAYRVRQTLNQGTDHLEHKVTQRLFEARQSALMRHRATATGSQLAGVGRITTDALFVHLRGAIAAMVLVIGAFGSYYWNSLEKAAEYAEIDSALLADEVPFSAYLDQGFVEWLNQRAQQSESSLDSVSQ